MSLIEDTFYQSDRATAASDKPLSDDLMPSNCVWKALPVWFVCPTTDRPSTRPLSVPAYVPPVPQTHHLLHIILFLLCFLGEMGYPSYFSLEESRC